jgi:hypothetical protein
LCGELIAGRLSFSADQLSPEAVVGAPLILFPRQSAPAFHDLVTGYYAAHGGQARIAQEAIIHSGEQSDALKIFPTLILRAF